MQKDLVTIIIKTFERPRSLKKLLRSIDQLGTSYPVIIADDSRQSVEKQMRMDFPGLRMEWISMPFDSGLSAGRNKLLSHVSTPYFVLCDDDFVFDKRADISRALHCIQTSDLAVLGGDFYNYVTIPGLKRLIKLLISDPARIKMFLLGEFQTSRYLGTFNLSGDRNCELLLSNKPPAVSPYRCDLVNNFFIADTAAIKKMGGWDPVLKMGEHEDFFLRIKQAGLTVAYLKDFGIAHFPIVRSGYKKYRQRAAQFKDLFVQKHKFRHYSERSLDTGELFFESTVQDQ